MVVKGDGSLISADTAALSPVETILSGPAASVVGATFLQSIESAVVVDMGGTTTDIAWIESGHPRLDDRGATVGGWRTMVQAIAVQTHGLGGDSAIRLTEGGRSVSIGPERILPLSRLAATSPSTLTVLQAQQAGGFVGTHAGRFVLAHRQPGHADLARLSRQQRWLWEQIRTAPIAVETLFREQTLERPLRLLLDSGLVLESGFTPSDASHVTGHQSTWNVEAARIGADLLMQRADRPLVDGRGDTVGFCRELREGVSRRSAIELAASAWPTGMGARERDLLEAAMSGDEAAILVLEPRLQRPVVGIGAPAASYLARAAELLNTRSAVHEHADVANALGAVVGSVRQQSTLLITAEGRSRVRSARLRRTGAVRRTGGGGGGGSRRD